MCNLDFLTIENFGHIIYRNNLWYSYSNNYKLNNILLLLLH